jgi:uncharacterized membrane protein YhaH (DUF805 family)
MFLPSRGRKGRDRYYPAKLAVFIVGTVLLLAGIRLDNGWLINGAITVLAVAVLIRLLPQKPTGPDTDADSGS